jgi:hypothetical protein
MMRGATLLEFVAGISLFLVLLTLSYHAFDAQRRLLNRMEERVTPEEESNYRMLLVKHFLDKCSHKLKVDPFLETVPAFFPDLVFGQSPQKSAFSVIHVTGIPIRFERSGASARVPVNSGVQAGKTYMLAGSTDAGEFGWSCELAEKTWSTTTGEMLTLKNLSGTPSPQKGTLIEVEVHGFSFQNQTLYWISPGGALQPYLRSLDSFAYEWLPPTLTVQWTKGPVKMEFRCAL